ncbi:MAG: FAD-binding oxidoreductase [Anaerolineae bacterium]|nr:FAD-binding oxidoreductase [Anaerolineae bacterium]
MQQPTADIVICGAGISGISAAYYLAVNHGLKNIILVDEREPLTFTSDKSTECYRNWWPGPGDEMVHYMNRSIDLLEYLADESDNYFGLNRRGYVFLTSDREKAKGMQAFAAEASALGAGELRIHHGRADDPLYTPHHAEGYKNMPEGADLILDPALIRRIFPFITDQAIAMLHPRRCGWLSAQQLGMYLLQQAKARGVQLWPGRLTDVVAEKGRVTAVDVHLADGGPTRIHTRCFLNAAGPLIGQVGQMLGLDLPIYNELHAKISIRDDLGIIPRDVPLMIWEDPVHLLWDKDERAELAADPELSWLLNQFPAGVHFRPEGAGDSPMLLILWTYDLEAKEVVWPPQFDADYPEIVLRGLARMVPGLAAYIGRARPWVDGGYYCKTRENRPLIGPLPVEGAYLFGAVSGYGIMASQAGGELIAAHITGSELPVYAPAFLLSRYKDPAYQQLLANWDATSGQL